MVHNKKNSITVPNDNRNEVFLYTYFRVYCK